MPHHALSGTRSWQECCRCLTANDNHAMHADRCCSLLADSFNVLGWQVRDYKGDTLEYPKVVASLPFWDSADTYFFDNDYGVSCPAGYTDVAGGKARAAPPVST